MDLRELALADLRRNVAAVLQETLVFDGTIRDNILWGRPEARERDVIAAAGRRRRRHVHPLRSRTATAPAWGSAAGRCRAASASGWRSPAR